MTEVIIRRITPPGGYLVYDLVEVGDVDAVVAQAVSDLVDGAPAALDKLNELADALGDDPNFSVTILDALALKAPIASPTFTDGTDPIAALTKRVLNGDDNVFLRLGTGQAVSDQTHDTYMTTLTPTGLQSFVETSGAGARAVGFNIGQWICRATDGASNLTRTGEFVNIEHDFIQFEQVGGTAIFNKAVSSRFRFAIPKTGVTIVDNKGIDFVVPNVGDVTGATTNYIAINIPALTAGGGTNFYGIRFNNAPNGGSIVAVNNDLVLRALTASQGIVLTTNAAAAGGVGALRIDGGLAGSVALRLAFGGSGTGHLLAFAKDVAGVFTNLMTLSDSGSGILAMGSNITINGNGNATFAGTLAGSFAVTSGGNISTASGGSVRVGTTDTGGGATVVGIKNATTVPNANPTGGGVVYVEAGALKYRGSSGTITVLAAA